MGRTCHERDPRGADAAGWWEDLSLWAEEQWPWAQLRIERAFFDPWEEPKPAEWPGGVLSKETEEALAAVSLRDGVDFGAQCSAYLAAASAAAPKNVRFDPYGDASWSVPPNLWILILAESGQRKTRILDTALAPLRDMHGARWGEYMDELQAWRSLSDEERRGKAKPSEPHSFIVNDATAEALELSSLAPTGYSANER